MKSLNALGVQEMDAWEISQTNGGSLTVAVLGFITVMGAVIYVYNNWDDFIEGIEAGYDAYQEQQVNS